jgi:hypothetical protein
MKSRSLFALTALATAGLAFGQPATTTPVGYVSQELKQGYNVIGLTMLTPILAMGVIDGVNQKVITDAAIAFTPAVGRTYILEITTGALNGTIQETNANSYVGTTITVNDDLEVMGLLPGDKYSIRVAPTLEEIFGTVTRASGGVLDAASSPLSADIIWMPNGVGGYDKYYLRAGAYRNADNNAFTPNIPFIYADGLLVQKKNLAISTLTVTGTIKTTQTNSIAIQGYNTLSPVAPVGLNLFNAGLEATLTQSSSELSADIVWVQQENLTYNRYYRRAGGWRLSGASSNLTQVQAEAVSLSRGFLVQRKSLAPINIRLNVPSGYSSL